MEEGVAPFVEKCERWTTTTKERRELATSELQTGDEGERKTQKTHFALEFRN